MTLKLDKVYDTPESFFSSLGYETILLSPEATRAVCSLAASHGIVIWRIEGGIWHNPGFEARVDCIWDGADTPFNTDEAHHNNLLAAEFVEEERDIHDVFIITTRNVDKLD